MKKFTIKPIENVQQLQEMQPWLDSFGHRIPPLVGRFHAFSKEDRVIALTQQVSLNALFPAINPKTTTPKDTYEFCKVLHAWSANMPGGLQINVPLDGHMNAHMAKLGFRPVSVLYESIP